MKRLDPVESSETGYMLTEALVYISAVFVLMGVGYVALHRCIDNSLVLRRNAQQISHTVNIGELWRQDLRSSRGGVTLETSPGEELLHLRTGSSEVDYLYTLGGVYRRSGSGPWSCVLDRVKGSTMHSEMRGTVAAWIWDIELMPETKGGVQAGRVRPVFSFIAVAPAASQQ